MGRRKLTPVREDVLNAVVNLEVTFLGIMSENFSEIHGIVKNYLNSGEFEEALVTAQDELYQRKFQTDPVIGGPASAKDFVENGKLIIDEFKQRDIDSINANSELSDTEKQAELKKIEEDAGIAKTNMDSLRDHLTNYLENDQTTNNQLIDFVSSFIRLNEVSDHDHEPRKYLYRHIIEKMNETRTDPLPDVTPIIKQINFVRNPHCVLIQGSDGTYYELCP